MKKDRLNKILVLSLLLVVFMTSTVFGISNDLSGEVIVDEVTTFDRFLEFFSVGKFTTLKTMGSFIEREGGEYFDLSFRMRCQAQSNSHKFSVGFSGKDLNYLDFTGSQTYTKNIACTPGTFYDVTLTNVKTPTYNGADCGALKVVRVKHETSVLGNWIIDTDEYDEIGGFEGVATLQVDCEADVCEGLTGKTGGSEYCVGDRVAIAQYTDIVKDGKCVTNNKILENCRYDCDDGECVFPETDKEPVVEEEKEVIPEEEDIPEEEEDTTTEPETQEEEEVITEEEDDTIPPTNNQDTNNNQEDDKLDTQILFYILTGVVVFLVMLTIVIVEIRRNK